MDTEKFAQFIAERRRELGLTQQELAEKLNVTDKAISRWENGRGFPDINTLEPLAEALGISVVELMKSEQIAEAISRETADEALSDTIVIAEEQTKRRARTTIAVVFAMIAAVFAVLLIWQVWAYFNPVVNIGYGIATVEKYDGTEWYVAKKMKSGEQNCYSGIHVEVKSRSVFGMSDAWVLDQELLNRPLDTLLNDRSLHRDDEPYLFLSKAETIGDRTHFTLIGYYTVDGETIPYYKTEEYDLKVNGTIVNLPDEYFEQIWEKFPDLKEAYDCKMPSSEWYMQYLAMQAGTEWREVTYSDGTTAWSLPAPGYEIDEDKIMQIPAGSSKDSYQIFFE